MKDYWRDLTAEEKSIAFLKLNFYKSTEMEVHPESRENTSLIVIEPEILTKMAKFKKKYKKMVEEIQASSP